MQVIDELARIDKRCRDNKQCLVFFDRVNARMPGRIPPDEVNRVKDELEKAEAEWNWFTSAVSRHADNK